MLDGADFEALVASMLSSGFDKRMPIYTLDGEILDGRNRWRAAKKAGVEPIVREFIGGDPLEFVVRANVTRRHLDESQRAIAGARLKVMFEAEAKERQREGGRTKLTANLQQASRSPTSGAKAAAMVSVSARSVESASKVLSCGTLELINAVEHGKIAASVAAKLAVMPEAQQRATVGKIERGEIKSAQAISEIKRESKRALGAELDANPVPLPTGQFDVIVIDPPWQYERRAEDMTHRGRNQYPDMSTDSICALPVQARAANDCVLWLWTTNAFMRDAFRCLDSWGFTEKTILTWAKDRMGMGDWLRGQTEHCIMAVRGKPLVTLTNQTTLLAAPMREHSRKPDEFFDLVGKLCHGSKLEMFSREARAGWTRWGAETDALT